MPRISLKKLIKKLNGLLKGFNQKILFKSVKRAEKILISNYNDYSDKKLKYFNKKSNFLLKEHESVLKLFKRLGKKVKEKKGE